MCFKTFSRQECHRIDGATPLEKLSKTFARFGKQARIETKNEKNSRKAKVRKQKKSMKKREENSFYDSKKD